MLSSSHRLRRSSDFARATRSGRGCRSGELVVYRITGSGKFADRRTASERGDVGPALASVGPRAGLIVGKAVGNSVVRHRVSRRIREQLRNKLPSLSPDDVLVVRALPGACTRSSAQIAEDLTAALTKLGHRR